MVDKIICCICSVLCAIPFFIFPLDFKNRKEPISFWSGDTSLKDKVVDVENYNKAMMKLYSFYGCLFFIAGILCFVKLMLGVVLLIFNTVFGIVFLYVMYKKILKKYS